jgi:hypothetical protein
MSITKTNIPILKQIASGRDYIDNLANKYILKPSLAQGIGGFVFDYEGETNVALNAEITDHYIEDNTTIQDHVALRPVRVTLRGFVNELSVNKNINLAGALAALNSRLETVEAYMGDYTPGMVQIMQTAITATQNAVNTIDQTLNRINNLAGLFSAPGQTKQEQAYQKLKSMWQTKQIITVSTPYEYYDTMVIESVSISQPEDTRYQSDITVTLKQIRFASVEYTKFNNQLFSGRLAQQKQDPVDGGKTKGTEVPESMLLKLFKVGF